MNTPHTVARNVMVRIFVVLLVLGCCFAAEAGHSNGSSSAVKIVYTYNGKVYTGTIIREVTQGYLFRLVENKTIVIPFEQIKKIRSLHEKKAVAPAARKVRRSSPRKYYRDLRPRSTSRHRSTYQDRNVVQDQDAPRRGYSAGSTFRRSSRYRRSGRDSVMARAQYRENSKSLTGPLLLNIFLPFAIGSWVARDYVGGGIGVGAQLTGGVFLVLGSMMYNPLPLAIPGMLLYLIGYAVPIGTVVMHVRGQNRKLKKRLGLARAEVGLLALPRATNSPIYQAAF